MCRQLSQKTRKPQPGFLLGFPDDLIFIGAEFIGAEFIGREYIS
jgi:hypothetical protein